MAQGKFTTSPTPSNIVSAVNAMVDDIAGKAASSHNHSAANITSGTLAVARGGTGVTANPSMLTNLGSTSAASVFAASPRPGITGTLPVANGGTGATTAAQARVNLGLDTGLAPTGTIIAYAGSSIPSGYLACNGGAISRTTYSALYSAIGTAYGAGNGSSTFNLPNLEDNRFMEFHSTPAITKDAGLPDHTHTVTHYTIWASEADGMRRLSEKQQNSADYPDVIKTTSKASVSNSIYGSSTTVQPKSLTVRAIIKY